MRPLELVCPAGTPASLRAAVDAGGDAVYLGFRDETNARNFPGLNFNREELKDGIAYAHERGAKVLVAINTYPRAGNLGPWHQAVDDAARLKADAVILADIGLANYAARRHPELRRHLSVQASASNPAAIGFYRRELGVRRVVLPRVLTIDEIAALNGQIDVETEVFVFGGLCVMAEGRCMLSSYATPCSPNREGVCSPAGHVRYVEKGTPPSPSWAISPSTSSRATNGRPTPRRARAATGWPAKPAICSRSRLPSARWPCCPNWRRPG